MKWKQKLWIFSGKMTKEKWLFLLCIGIFLMILSAPLPGEWLKKGKQKDEGYKEITGEEMEAAPLWNKEEGDGTIEGLSDQGGAFYGGTGSREEKDGLSYPASASPSGNSYEMQLENRIKEILKSVEGVGEVDVMVVLKSSSEKVMRVDRSGSSDTTKETDSAGGTRQITNSQTEESTVLTSPSGSGTGNTPIIEKELSPQLSGIVISAEGGGSPQVKTEISEAMEALFGLPAHKIKVLKRVDK